MMDALMEATTEDNNDVAKMGRPPGRVGADLPEVERAAEAAEEYLTTKTQADKDVKRAQRRLIAAIRRATAAGASRRALEEATGLGRQTIQNLLDEEERR